MCENGPAVIVFICYQVMNTLVLLSPLRPRSIFCCWLLNVDCFSEEEMNGKMPSRRFEPWQTSRVHGWTDRHPERSNICIVCAIYKHLHMPLILPTTPWKTQCRFGLSFYRWRTERIEKLWLTSRSQNEIERTTSHRSPCLNTVALSSGHLVLLKPGPLPLNTPTFLFLTWWKWSRSVL